MFPGTNPWPLAGQAQGGTWAPVALEVPRLLPRLREARELMAMGASQGRPQHWEGLHWQPLQREFLMACYWGAGAGGPAALLAARAASPGLGRVTMQVSHVRALCAIDAFFQP